MLEDINVSKKFSVNVNYRTMDNNSDKTPLEETISVDVLQALESRLNDRIEQLEENVFQSQQHSRTIQNSPLSNVTSPEPTDSQLTTSSQSSQFSDQTLTPTSCSELYDDGHRDLLHLKLEKELSEERKKVKSLENRITSLKNELRKV